MPFGRSFGPNRVAVRAGQAAPSRGGLRTGLASLDGTQGRPAVGRGGVGSHAGRSAGLPLAGALGHRRGQRQPASLCGGDLGDPKAVLIVDEMEFLKKGTKSTGVQRQYTGTAGLIENSRVREFLGYASRHGRVLTDRALYLPEGWTLEHARGAGTLFSCVATLVGAFRKIAKSRILMQDWHADADRRKKARVPNEVVFVAKPGLALVILARNVQFT